MSSSARASINGYTAWANMRLVREDCESDNVLLDVMQGIRLKVLLHYITGVAPKKLDDLSGLTAAQKVTRVDWFIDALKTFEKLPKLKKFDPQMFSLLSADHVFPVFWHLVCNDIISTWEISPIFQKHHELHVTIADPIEYGPCRISRTTQGKPMVQPFYITADGKSVTQMYKRTLRHKNDINAASTVIELINGQLKMTVDGRKLYIQSLADLIDSRVLCALVNSLIPGTFTTHVMLNDRWSINVALKTAAEIFRVKCRVDSQDIYENEEEGMCAFLTYFIMSGYQFRQAQAVLEKMRELNLKIEDLQIKLHGLASQSTSAVKQRKQIQAKVDRTTDELKWIETVYDIDQCVQWEEHAKQLQAKVREMIALKMKQRFDTVVVPRPMTINRLIESMVINLSLTGGNGFYHSDGKESLWTGRKMIIRDKETGEYIDNFSGSENSKSTVREMLKVHPYELVEINATSYPKLELFFESSSRNKTLKGGSKFLYQVFPGTTSQCERVLLRASRVGEIITVQKLVLFFHKNKEFVNCRDPETGNTALHLASRHGHFEIVLHMLENGAHINAQNNSGCTPFFLATEGLHKQVSQLLMEWGADIYLKNKVSKTALELIRNSDLKAFLETKFTEYKELTSKLTARDINFLVNYLKAHVSKQNQMASLRSRCVNGNTLFHMAAALGSIQGIELILTEHIDPNILNSKGATALHFARKPAIIKSLIEHGATVDATDHCGNTALHILCGDKDNAESVGECIQILVDSGARLDLQNNQGHLPLHCGASQGLIAIIKTVLAHDTGRSTNEMFRVNADVDETVPSLIYLSLAGDHLEAAKWLNSNGFSMKLEEADKLTLRILTSQQPKCTQPAETFQFLLQCGANPNAEYTEANRPLHLSVRLVNDPEITYLLLDHGAEVDPRNSSQSTPLFAACKANNPYIASTLIKRGADCHAQDLNGRFAFDYIKDHKEWIDSGYFDEDIRAQLKTFSLKHSRELIKSISKRMNTSRLK